MNTILNILAVIIPLGIVIAIIWNFPSFALGCVFGVLAKHYIEGGVKELQQEIGF
jgi:hypothetical protein